MTKRKNVSPEAAKRRKGKGRITLIIVLGVFVVLAISMVVSTGAMSLIAQYWHIDDDNALAFGAVMLAISVVVGLALSFALSAIIGKAVSPYIEALQKIAACDFSVRIEDSIILAGFGVAETFNNTAESLASVETLREDFVSNFSHEFKTPIVSISGFAKLLKSANLSPAEREEYLDVIIDESSRLVSLSESVLTLSRLDSQTVINEEFLLDEQIRQCVLLFSRTCQEKKLEVVADLEEIKVVNSKKMLSQVWVNLLSNAVKFTPAGGKIEVNAWSNGDTITVQIADNGCGMDEETQKNIFNKFYQGDASHFTEGNGLGLAVVKKICNLLKLDISVQSAPQQGSKFTVIFKADPAVKNLTTTTKQVEEAK